MARKKSSDKTADAKADKKTTKKADVAADAAAASHDAARDAGAMMPVLYKQPAPLTPERHGKQGLLETVNFSFAATTNSVPINAAEFPYAMHHYPIVFAGEGPVMTVVVLGVKEAENVFVDKDGKWADGHYVPAYVRRYPFIFMAGADKQQYLLCVDEESGLLSEKKAQMFFDGNDPTEVTKRALNFCTAYQQQSELTKDFAAAMEAADILVPNRAEITTPSGEKVALGGFRVIDEKKFNDLPDKTFLEWRKKGWLPLVYCHLLSTSNWSRLINRQA